MSRTKSRAGGYKHEPSAWDATPASNQSMIGGSAVRTKGNPWGDADGGKSHIANMASDAWKSGGY